MKYYWIPYIIQIYSLLNYCERLLNGNVGYSYCFGTIFQDKEENLISEFYTIQFENGNALTRSIDNKIEEFMKT